ncbi:hypothetical protein PCL_00433 [Purpureocillium lilacinum]|uniref:Uncharacterized protein n=1 Tax=Purpureocillium lilacinum TaxID=33203 RepID=A0A2U3DP57_PURLI|nr:hypothetical protein PCL_00433 [Purpureocillium lilacinum]
MQSQHDSQGPIRLASSGGLRVHPFAAICDMSPTGNHTNQQIQDAIGRRMYQIFTTTATNQELIHYGEEVLEWYKNPQVTDDSDATYQLDTVHAMWQAELPTVGDEEALRKISSLRVRISAAAAALQHEN